MHVGPTLRIALLAAAGIVAAVPVKGQSAPVQAESAAASRPVPLSALTAYANTSAAAALLHAQNDATAMQAAGGWSSLRIAKWTTAALAAGAAAYGVINNRKADDEFEQLEQLCVEQVDRCTERLPDGSYADADMESQYQNVRALDRRARTALIAGQLGIAASVVLFVLDLRNNDGPANIPYDPDTLDISPARDGGMSLRVNVRMPR